MILYDFINCPAFVDIFFAFLCWIKFCSCCFRQVFFIWESKKVVAGHFKKQLFDRDLLGWTQHWLFYKGGCLNRFHCNALS